MALKNYRTSQTSKRKKDTSGRKIWGSNISTVVLVLLLVLSFVKVTKEVLLRYEIHQEIKHLENQKTDLEGQKGQMEQLISYLKTDEYIEKQARLKLNLSKPGEKQINITSGEYGEEIALDGENSPNFVKWFNYFFK
ncbi:septum formation initiator family protein [Candidatus Parcubacteria bacterium]|jgi:cell division protein FtsB|nr:septum formation initiator family protein [Candidatus Parcubacteria bacterium]